MYLENFPEKQDKGKINGDIFWYVFVYGSQVEAWSQTGQKQANY